jgi:hypothetical protein
MFFVFFLFSRSILLVYAISRAHSDKEYFLQLLWILRSFRIQNIGSFLKCSVFSKEIEQPPDKELERRKKAQETRESFKKANEELLKIQADIAIKEKEEEKRI